MTADDMERKDMEQRRYELPRVYSLLSAKKERPRITRINADSSMRRGLGRRGCSRKRGRAAERSGTDRAQLLFGDGENPWITRTVPQVVVRINRDF
jgi:hypothetical protein